MTARRPRAPALDGLEVANDNVPLSSVAANDNAPTEPRRRKRSPRLRVISPLQLPPDWEMRSLAEPGAPRTRGDCANVPRPCPYIACRAHLWLRLEEEQPGNPQAGKQGQTTFRPSTMQSCSLDVAERGASFEEVGNHLGMDSTRARQIAQAAIEKLQAADPENDWRELVEAAS